MASESREYDLDIFKEFENIELGQDKRSDEKKIKKNKEKLKNDKQTVIIDNEDNTSKLSKLIDDAKKHSEINRSASSNKVVLEKLDKIYELIEKIDKKTIQSGDQSANPELELGICVLNISKFDLERFLSPEIEYEYEGKPKILSYKDIKTLFNNFEESDDMMFKIVSC